MKLRCVDHSKWCFVVWSFVMCYQEEYYLRMKVKVSNVKNCRLKIDLL